jgi:single-strand DNA-binding protein
MAGSINRVILLGHVGKDPDIRTSQDGRKIVNLRIATSETWRDKSTGERKEATQWHSVVIFSEGLCKVAEAYVHKGSRLYIEGALQTRRWKDADGSDRYSTEVVLQGFSAQLVLLDGKSDTEPASKPVSATDKPAPGKWADAAADSEIPF